MVLRVERPVWLYAGLCWIVAGGCADLALTLWGLRLGAIYEANPLLAPLVAFSPALAAGLKVGVTVGAALIFHQGYARRPRLVAASVTLVGVILLAVMALHVAWLRLVHLG